MNEANEDDVVALPIGPDEIACLANTKVPDGSYIECTALRDDLWEYGQNNPVPAIFVIADWLKFFAEISWYSILNYTMSIFVRY
jgi:hypothetical protein